MTHAKLENLNVESLTSMPTPEEIHTLLPLSDKAAATVATSAGFFRLPPA